jgi:TetR/AcrR family transcriptional repressor of nem operon
MADTKDTILAAALSIVQARGYNGLSFRDLAKSVGIKSASIHHYFPSKADLGAALVRRYRTSAVDALQAVRDRSPNAGVCLREYADGFRQTLADSNRMCLCGVLGAEYDELPEPVKAEVAAFVDDNVTWIANVLSSSATLSSKEACSQATAIYAALSGAQLAARTRADITVFDTAAEGYRCSGLIPQ